MSGTKWCKRRHLQFSILGLALLFVAVGVPLAWLANRARQQQQAVKALKAVGGKVQYDDQALNVETVQYAAQPSALGWLRGWISDDYLFSVVAVKVPRSYGTDIDYGPWSATGLSSDERERILVERTDAAVLAIGAFRELRYLSLLNTRATDAGLHGLHRLSKLQLVDLRGSNVSEQAVRELRRALPAAEILY